MNTLNPNRNSLVDAAAVPSPSFPVPRLALALLAAALLSGCLSRPSPGLNKQSFSFSIPPAPSAPPPAHGRVLAIRQLRIAAPFDSQSFLYRIGEFSYEHDPYAQFLVPPAGSLMAPIRGYFRESGLFSAVVELGSALQPNTLVEISLSQLYGDFRNHAAPAAVLSMRFAFFDATNGLPGKLLFQKDYARRIPIKARTAAALMAGWNEALAQIMKDVNADLKASRALQDGG